MKDRHLPILFKRRLLLSLLPVIVLSWSCGVTSPPDDPPAPTGAPNWDDPQYDWLSTYRECPTCLDHAAPSDYFIPKFRFEVMDMSADGDQLLLNTFEGVKLYDLESRSASRIAIRFLPYEETWAQWSVDGRSILRGTNVLQAPSPFYYLHSVYRLSANEWEYVDVGDVESVFPGCWWMPGDSSICARYTYEGERYLYEVACTAPYARRRLRSALPNFTVANGRVFWFEERDRDDPAWRATIVAGRGSMESGITGEARALREAVWINPPFVEYFSELFARTSRNGNFAAIAMGADLVGTRFASADMARNAVPAIGIIDLRQESPTYLQVYRVFPDALGTYRVCAEWTRARFAISPDGRYLYHTWLRISDSTTQIARRDISTGKLTLLTDLRRAP